MAEWLGGLMQGWPAWLIVAVIVVVFVAVAVTDFVDLQTGYGDSYKKERKDGKK